MAGNPLTDPNWAEATTEQVVKLVDTVKAKTTKPAVMAARGLVFGLLAIFLGLFALVLLLVGLTRGLQAALEPLPWFFDQARAVYVSYFIVGGALTLLGAILFRMRNNSSGAV